MVVDGPNTDDVTKEWTQVVLFSLVAIMLVLCFAPEMVYRITASLSSLSKSIVPTDDQQAEGQGGEPGQKLRLGSRLGSRPGSRLGSRLRLMAGARARARVRVRVRSWAVTAWAQAPAALPP